MCTARPEVNFPGFVRRFRTVGCDCYVFFPAPGQVQVQWMQKPQGPAGCPPGLEYLTQIDQLLVHQQVGSKCTGES